MAIMLEQLDLRPGHRVLEIGAGTGYNAALLARIVGQGGRVVAVDIDGDLVRGAARHLLDAGVTGVELVCGDGALGHPPGAPYDRIVLTVGSGDIRPEWIAQLAPGGRLLLPLQLRGTQLSVALDLGPDGVLRSDSVGRCAFVRLRGVGALHDAGMSVGAELTALPADGRTVDPELVASALAMPGGSRPLPRPLGASDLWDGFGLWLALAEPGTCRLLTAADTSDELDAGSASELLPLGAGRATVALLPDRPDQAGMAAVVLDPVADPEAPGPWPVRVRAFGPTGGAVADRVHAAYAAWTAAGRPTVADLRLTVTEHAGRTPPEPPPGAVAVDTPHCRVFVHLATTGG
jgi:protein-L-isoaspartate(D-aspartate) O-methyltransferase